MSTENIETTAEEKKEQEKQDFGEKMLNWR